MIGSLRRRCVAIVESTWFQRAIITLILVNGLILGLETYPAVMDAIGPFLITLNTVVVTVFVAEIALRITAYGRAFFRDGWSLFDLAVVSVALVPSGAEYAVARILRLLRVLRLLSAVRSMRVVVSALGAAIPGILSSGGLLLMIVYVFAVSSSTLFAARAPENFDDLWISVVSLFRLMINDGWSDIVAPMAREDTWIWGYFIVYTVLTTFVVLNLFVAVTVDAMSRSEEPLAGPGDRGDGDRSDERRRDDGAPGEDVAAELRALREQMARLEARLAERDREGARAGDSGG